jgi:hypothetical protein
MNSQNLLWWGWIAVKGKEYARRMLAAAHRGVAVGFEVTEKARLMRTQVLVIAYRPYGGCGDVASLPEQLNAGF